MTLVESHEGPAGSDYQVNTASNFVVGEGAQVDLLKIVGEGADALHISTLLASIGARARFKEVSFTIGGAVIRNQRLLRFAGENAYGGFGGATLLKARQHADAMVVADHEAGHCQSRELFKAVLDGECRNVFQGQDHVHPHAQKTDARMMTRALLLSETAEAVSKPELEIFADDVSVRPWRHHRSARRRIEVLPDGARHSGQGGGDAPGAGLHRRGDRRNRPMPGCATP